MDNLPIIEITSTTWNPADLQMPGPQLTTPTCAVNCKSTAGRDLWSLSTAPLSAISPLLNFPYDNSHYSAAVLVHGAHRGTRGNVSATFTSERHAKVNFENLSRKGKIGLNTVTCICTVDV